MVTKFFLVIKNKKNNFFKWFLENDEENCIENEEDSSDEWYIEQNINPLDELNINNKFNYGFALTKSNIFSKLSVRFFKTLYFKLFNCFVFLIQSEYLLIFDLQNPDEISYPERTRLRIENENEKFDEDHYLADIYDNDLIEESFLKYSPFWCSTDKNEISEKSINNFHW